MFGVQHYMHGSVRLLAYIYRCFIWVYFLFSTELYCYTFLAVIRYKTFDLIVVIIENNYFYVTSDVTVTGFTIIPCFGFCFYVIYFYTFPFSLSLVQSYVAILSRVSLFDVCFESEATHPWAVNFCKKSRLLPRISPSLDLDFLTDTSCFVCDVFYLINGEFVRIF